MKRAGPFTFFAPTDDAFAKVPKATLDALLKDKQKQNQAGAKRLGAFVAMNSAVPVSTLAPQYFRAFMEVMAHTPNRKGHTNVLQHLAGYFGDRLARQDRAELTATIQRYYQSLLPLIVPMTLIRHYVRKFDVDYLRDQIYLDPHPHELMLLNEL